MKTVWYWLKNRNIKKKTKQKYRSMVQDRKHRDKPTHIVTKFTTKEATIYNGEKTALSISGTGKTRQLHVKE